ncbi:MAG: hypothetical protein HKN91_17005 [Acidimicrobiia bacterium]|nr:hypothetical protein [Acidimicrobiia bacterium]
MKSRSLSWTVLVAAILSTACSGATPTTTSRAAAPATTQSDAPTTLVAPSPASTSTTSTTSTIVAPTRPPQATWAPVESRELRVLFVGNSHTSTHDIPGQVAALLESNGSIEVTHETLKTGFLRMALNQSDITEAIASGTWDIVVLQGQELSMSHSTLYSQDEPVALARLVIDSGSRALFFSEWKQEGVEETAYIEDIYQQMAAKAGAEVIPIGRAWDRYLAGKPDHPLWSNDGNHSSPQGAFLAAAAIAYYLAGPNANLRTTPDLKPFLEPARLAVADYLGST